jgi:hypothetical protein
VLALSVLLALTSGTASSAAESSWTWNVQCGASALFIEVRLDGHSMYHAVVPICRRGRPEQRQAGSAPSVAFSFRPARAIVWHGYRDSEDAAPAGAPLVIELWQASADANTLMLGVTASDPTTQAIYMKTVHVAKVDQDSATDIARGLTLFSHPYRLGSR